MYLFLGINSLAFLSTKFSGYIFFLDSGGIAQQTRRRIVHNEGNL